MYLVQGWVGQVGAEGLGDFQVVEILVLLWARNVYGRLEFEQPKGLIPLV